MPGTTVRIRASAHIRVSVRIRVSTVRSLRTDLTRITAAIIVRCPRTFADSKRVRQDNLHPLHGSILCRGALYFSLPPERSTSRPVQQRQHILRQGTFHSNHFTIPRERNTAGVKRMARQKEPMLQIW